jgi:hydroxyethylthiazole kinase-like uncharacterized protein yjeF
MSLIVNIEQMKAMENEADRKGNTFESMMARAGKAVYEETVRQYGPVQGKSVVVLCGGGNNGGDGLVAAVHFAQAGAKVRVYQAADRRTDDPRLKEALAAGVSSVSALKEPGRQELCRAVVEADVLVDAVLGTGSRLPIRAPLSGIMGAVKESLEHAGRRPFLAAVDCPSGLDCDSGQAAAQTLSADLTITLAAAKKGLLLFPGAEFVGRLVVADIGIPADADSSKMSGPILADPRLVKGWLRPRPRDAHKGTFGRVIVVGGSTNYPGAPALAALGAYRSGAGLVTLAVPGPVYSSAVPIIPEATWIVLPEDFGVIASNAMEVLASEMATAQVLVIGPGMGKEKSTATFLRSLLQRGRGRKTPIGFGVPQKTETEQMVKPPPLVIDADALRILSEMDAWPALLPPNSILTPHPGEMSALAGIPKEEIQKDRSGTALRFAKEWNAVVVLKGAFTVIAAPDERCAVEPFATPALARAGTGDVLAGTIGGLVAQGMDSWQAAVLGAYLHGRAGELAAAGIGACDPVLAGDVARCLSQSIAELRAGC